MDEWKGLSSNNVCICGEFHAGHTDTHSMVASRLYVLVDWTDMASVRLIAAASTYITKYVLQLVDKWIDSRSGKYAFNSWYIYSPPRLAWTKLCMMNSMIINHLSLA